MSSNSSERLKKFRATQKKRTGTQQQKKKRPAKAIEAETIVADAPVQQQEQPALGSPQKRVRASPKKAVAAEQQPQRQEMAVVATEEPDATSATNQVELIDRAQSADDFKTCMKMMAEQNARQAQQMSQLMQLVQSTLQVVTASQQQQQQQQQQLPAAPVPVDHQLAASSNGVPSQALIPLDSSSAALVPHQQQQQQQQQLGHVRPKKILTRPELEAISNGTHPAMLAPGSEEQHRRQAELQSQASAAIAASQAQNHGQVRTKKIDFKLTGKLQAMPQRNVANLLCISESSVSKMYKSTGRKWPHRSVSKADALMQTYMMNIEGINHDAVPSVLERIRQTPDQLHNEEYLRRIGLNDSEARDTLYKLAVTRQAWTAPVFIKVTVVDDDDSHSAAAAAATIAQQQQLQIGGAQQEEEEVVVEEEQKRQAPLVSRKRTASQMTGPLVTPMIQH